MKNNETKNKREFLITRNEIIALFIFTALIFATLYFVQLYITNERIRDITQYSESKVGSILVIDSDNYSNLLNSATNKILSKEEFDNSINSAMNNYKLTISEDIKQIIKSTSDVNIFWLSFIMIVVLIFSIFTISITRDYCEKARLYSISTSKRMDKIKDFELKFMSELINISNTTRDTCAKYRDDITKASETILELGDIDKFSIKLEEFDNIKKDLFLDVEISLRKLREDNLLLFDEEITAKYNELLKYIEDRNKK